MGKVLDARYCFFYFYLLILLLFCLCWKALPRQVSTDEVHQHYTDLFQVIPARLLDPQVSIKARISGSPRETFTVTERNVPTGFRVLVPLCQAKVDYVDDVLASRGAYQEVVRLDVPVQEPVLMNEFNPLKLQTRAT